METITGSDTMILPKGMNFTVYGDYKGISDHINGRVYDLTTEDGYISLIECLENQQEKIKRLTILNNHKREEITERVLALQEVADKYINEELFKNDVNPNAAVQQVLHELLNTTFEVDCKKCEYLNGVK